MAGVPISVFISYSRSDSAFIDRMEAELRSYGFDTWVDRQHLEGGTDWARLIEQEIVKRETLVVSLSPDAITSTWVRREITFALNASKHIIPIIVRPVERVPIEIIEKQYIDLHSDYAHGLQELRVALLKTRILPAPPPPAHVPQPLLAMPDVSDPLKGLVQIPAPPPAPNPDINAAFMQAQAALAHDNLDLAEALLRQIVEQQDDFGYGLAVEELDRVRKQLEPKQIERLRAMAYDAWARGAWGQAIGALRALMERQPQDRDLPTLLTEAENCQKWAWLYDNARAFAQSGDAAATRVALAQLWEKAPYFRDPARIAPQGLIPAQTRPTSSERQRYCPSCGSVVDAQAPMCSLCGRPLPPSSPEDILRRLKEGRERSNLVSGLPALIVTGGKEPGRVIPLTTVPFTIGRSRESSLFIEDLALSRLHTSIVRDGNGAYWVEDNNSANGTFVNGTRISQQPLQVGDEIQIGQTRLKFDYAR